MKQGKYYGLQKQNEEITQQEAIQQNRVKNAQEKPAQQPYARWHPSITGLPLKLRAQLLHWSTY